MYLHPRGANKSHAIYFRVKGSYGTYIHKLYQINFIRTVTARRSLVLESGKAKEILRAAYKILLLSRVHPKNNYNMVNKIISHKKLA